MHPGSTVSSSAAAAVLKFNVVDPDVLHRAYALVLITLPLSAILIPVLFLIFFLSDSQARRTSIFVLSAAVLVLGIIQGLLSTLVQSLLILHPPTYIPDPLFLTFIGVALYTPVVVDCVLILRLSAVYPSVLIRMRTRFTLLFVPTICTAARIACITALLHQWSSRAAASADPGSAFDDRNLIWPRNPFIIADWAVQLLENTYCASLFVARLGTRKVLSSRMYREQSFAKVLRALIYIAVGNFVFPTLLSGVQLVFIVHDPSMDRGVAVLLVNNFVSILGAVFSTIWSTSDAWKFNRRQAQAMDMYGTQVTCDTLSQNSTYSLRQSVISLSGIAPNLTPTGTTGAVRSRERHTSFASRLSLSSLSASLSLRSASLSVAAKSLSYSKRSSISSAAGGTTLGKRFTMLSNSSKGEVLGATMSRVSSGSSGKLSKAKRRHRERRREMERERERELEKARRALVGGSLLDEKVPVSNDGQPLQTKNDKEAEANEERFEDVALDTPITKSKGGGRGPQAGLALALPPPTYSNSSSNNNFSPVSMSPRIFSSRLLKLNSSSMHSLKTQHTGDTGTDFDFGSTTPPPQTTQQSHSHSHHRTSSQSRHRANGHSASVALSLASSSAYTTTTNATNATNATGSSDRIMREDLANMARGQVTVLDFRRMENRTPPIPSQLRSEASWAEGGAQTQRQRGREEDIRWNSIGIGGSDVAMPPETLLPANEERRPSEATIMSLGGSTVTARSLGGGTTTGVVVANGARGGRANNATPSPSSGGGTLAFFTSFGFGKKEKTPKEKERDLEVGAMPPPSSKLPGGRVVPWQ